VFVFEFDIHDFQKIIKKSKVVRLLATTLTPFRIDSFQFHVNVVSTLVIPFTTYFFPLNYFFQNENKEVLGFLYILFLLNFLK
jgi:hypothetical protein